MLLLCRKRCDQEIQMLLTPAQSHAALPSLSQDVESCAASVSFKTLAAMRAKQLLLTSTPGLVQRIYLLWMHITELSPHFGGCHEAGLLAEACSTCFKSTDCTLHARHRLRQFGVAHDTCPAPATHVSNMSAFIRRQPAGSRAPLDLGTRPGLHGQVLISTGLAGLDRLLGGGLPLGSILLLLEDSNSQQHLNLIKCFMAEGICCKHSVAWVTAQKLSPDSTAAFLPDQARTGSSSSSSQVSILPGCTHA
eukprot:GHRQ01020588.1.p1 GENE.GHRQ01020588.1~~GHRQ01020588.1.p1  ORF type:complete len:250 (+),score=18.12 GHRQ01020588.1:591-1340(+)